jgi:hypothetical protein
MPAQLAEGLPHRLREIPMVVALDQVGDDLRVGLGAEAMALGLELAPELGMVLDDPVEDDVDLVLAVAVRVGVLLGDPPVSRPASVGDAGLGDGRLDRDRAAAVLRMLLDRGAQVRQIADRAHAVDLAVRDHRNAGRVIAPVLELLEAGNQQVPARSVAYISDYAAHKGCKG